MDAELELVSPLEVARDKIKRWRRNYNEFHPHSANRHGFSQIHLKIDLEIVCIRFCCLTRTIFYYYLFLYEPLRHHRIRNLRKARDVRARDEVVAETVFFRGFCGVVVDVLHDRMEFFVHFLRAPA